MTKSCFLGFFWQHQWSQEWPAPKAWSSPLPCWTSTEVLTASPSNQWWNISLISHHLLVSLFPFIWPVCNIENLMLTIWREGIPSCCQQINGSSLLLPLVLLISRSFFISEHTVPLFYIETRGYFMAIWIYIFLNWEEMALGLYKQEKNWGVLS